MQYEIRQGRLTDIKTLKCLWNDVFHDDLVYIDNFFEAMYSAQTCFVATHEDIPVAMLHILPSKLVIGEECFDAGYIYAVATSQEHRNNGVMLKLESAATDYANKVGISLLALVPANQSLFKMYEKIGYKTVTYKMTTTVAAEYITEFELSDCPASYFLISREDYISKNFAYFDLVGNGTGYRYDEALMSGEVLIYKDKNYIGYIVGVKNGHEYLIRETNLPVKAFGRAAYALMQKYYKLQKVSVVSSVGRRKPYGMMKAVNRDINLFDIKKLNPAMNLMLD